MPFESTVIPARTLYRNVRCDGCNIELKPVGPIDDNGEWTCLQPDDALEVHLTGGYGMAIDPIDVPGRELVLLFCASCTEKLSEQWPAIAKIIAKF